MENEVACTKCMWYGSWEESEFEDFYGNEIYACPECGENIEGIRHEYLPYQQSFGWNRI